MKIWLSMFRSHRCIERTIRHQQLCRKSNKSSERKVHPSLQCLSHTFLYFSFLAAPQKLIMDVEDHLGVHNQSDDEDDVNDGEGDEGVVEG